MQVRKLNNPKEIEWKSEKDCWNEYALEDGTTLKLKLVLTGVVRTEDFHPQTGVPSYVVSTQVIVRTTNVPEKLRMRDPQ